MCVLHLSPKGLHWLMRWPLVCTPNTFFAASSKHPPRPMSNEKTSYSPRAATPAEDELPGCPSLSLSSEEGQAYTVFLDVPGDVLEQISDAFGPTDSRPKDIRSEVIQVRLRPLLSEYTEPGQPFVDRHTLRRLLAHEKERGTLSLGPGFTFTRSQVAVGILFFGVLLLFLVVYGMFVG